jgi:hypothetical protein
MFIQFIVCTRTNKTHHLHGIQFSNPSQQSSMRTRMQGHMVSALLHVSLKALGVKLRHDAFQGDVFLIAREAGGEYRV